MSGDNSYLSSFINSELKSEEIKNIDSDLYNNGFQKPLHELQRAIQKHKDSQKVVIFAYGLILKYLEDNQVEPKLSILLFEEMDQFIQADLGLKILFYFYLDSTLRKYIQETTDLVELARLGKIASNIKLFDKSYVESFLSIESQVALATNETILKVLEGKNQNEAELRTKENAKLLHKLNKRGFDIKESGELLNLNIIQNIEEKITFFYPESKDWFSIQNDYQIIDYMKKYGEGSNDAYRIFECEGKLEKLEPKKNLGKDKVNEFTEVQLDMSLFDKTNIHNIQLVKEIETEFGKVSLHRGISGENPVSIKQYDIYKLDSSPDNENVRQELEQKIEREAKCAQFLGQKAEQNSYFFKYYGCKFQNNTYTIATEYCEGTLMNYMEALKQGNELANSFQSITSIIVHLLKMFSDLANFNIYHGNIMPHNIFIDQSLRVKIKDPYYSVTKLEELPAGLSGSIQDAEGYSLPAEDRISLEKADVYSLGLVILQLVTLENVSSIENRNALLEEIKKKYPKWLHSLLLNMLEKDEQKRSRFNKLYSVVDKEDSLTRSNISSYSNN